MNGWFLCVDCERCYRLGESRTVKVKNALTGLFNALELCPYEDCSGNSEITYEIYDEDTEINGWSGGWPWEEVLEAIPYYPRSPKRGEIYRIYPICPPFPIYLFRDRPNSAIRVTLDTNELFNIHYRTGDIDGLGCLMELHSRGIIKICIPAISASENRPGGLQFRNYTEFEAFVASLGFKNYEELSPILLLDKGYIGHGLSSNPIRLRLAHSIHAILFPTMAFDSPNHETGSDASFTPGHARKWLNAICDTMAIWSHIHHRADFFVTEDRNFQKQTKKPRLLELGARQICTPSECVSELMRFGYL